MTVKLGELLSDSLKEEADEICTPEIRDRMWGNIEARINAKKSPKQQEYHRTPQPERKSL